MPAIAIVDDRKTDRETIGRVVRSILKQLKEDEKWAVVLDEPPEKERDILHWLDENDATVLVTDWKLNEGAKSERVVTYEADRLIKEIRSKRPSFPIFVITGFESEARAYLKEVENIFSRNEFTKNAAIVIPQILRAGLRRYEEQRDLLTRMDVLARHVATGKATKTEREELNSINGYFQADLPAIVTLDTVLGELEKVTKRADILRRKVEKRVKAEKPVRPAKLKKP
jgi:DNA-binding NarL/FixJ family response regulator